MQTKRMIAVVLLCWIIASCTSRQVTPTSAPLNIHPDVTFTVSPVSTEDTFPPKSTPESVTPIAFDPNTQDIIQVIDSTYQVPLACKLDWLDPSNNEPPYNATPDPLRPRKLDFVDITEQVNLEKVWIRQITDNTNKKYRAYLVEEPLPDKCDVCIRSAVYVKNFQNDHIYRIDFGGYLPNRVLYGLKWIGNQVVTFAQNDSPTYNDLVGINIETKSYVYLASYTRCSR